MRFTRHRSSVSVFDSVLGAFTFEGLSGTGSGTKRDTESEGAFIRICRSIFVGFDSWAPLEGAGSGVEA